jgi:hypothetical protein
MFFQVNLLSRKLLKRACGDWEQSVVQKGSHRSRQRVVLQVVPVPHRSLSRGGDDVNDSSTFSFWIYQCLLSVLAAGRLVCGSVGRNKSAIEELVN